MKILFYNHTGKVSGAERVMLMILARLDRSHFEPVVLCPADGPLTNMVSQLGVRTVAIDELSARFTWRPLRLLKYLTSFVGTMRQARASVLAESANVIHANSIRAGLVLSAATLGMQTPIVWHAHDLLPRHPLSTAIRLCASVFPRIEVVAVSAAVAAAFRGKVLRRSPGRPRITVIHNAVDLELFQENAEKRATARRQLRLSDQDLVIGTVGQLTPRKGQRELIAAFTEVARDFPNAKLVIVGEALFNRDFEYAVALKNAAQQLGDRVLFLGQREDVADITRALDVAVVNSHAEPFGLTVVEAMAAGTTVLARAVDGIPEIVEHSETGLLVKNGDRHALVESLRILLADANLRAELSKNAVSSVRSRFAPERFMSDFHNLYRRHGVSSTTYHAVGRFALDVKLSAD